MFKTQAGLSFRFCLTIFVQEKMKRRNFIIGVFLGGIFSYFSSFWRNSLSAPGQNKDREGFTKIGTITQLKKEGKILIEDSPIGAVLVMFTPENSLIAIDPTCTHAGCTVAWQKDKKAFVCPCHNSEFTLQGEVIKGRATLPLNTYQVKTEGDVIFLKKTSS
jgi:cytochrome b6-f complex iron-sulfur subunit